MIECKIAILQLFEIAQQAVLGVMCIEYRVAEKGGGALQCGGNGAGCTGIDNCIEVG